MLCCVMLSTSAHSAAHALVTLRISAQNLTLFIIGNITYQTEFRRIENLNCGLDRLPIRWYCSLTYNTGPCTL